MSELSDQHDAAAEYIGGLTRDPQALADALRQLTGAREVAVRYDAKTDTGSVRIGQVAVSTRPTTEQVVSVEVNADRAWCAVYGRGIPLHHACRQGLCH